MKKVIIAAAFVFATGIVATTVNKESNTKTTKAPKAAVAIDKSVLGTAD